MRISKQNLLVTVLAAIGLVAGLGLSHLFNHGLAPATKTSTIPGLMWPGGKTIQPFSLIDQQGKTFDLSHLTDQWSLLFFGYTHCPDVCPNTMTLLKGVKSQLQDGNTIPPQVIFVTVDPERDTQQFLADYMAYFDPEFIGLTGDQEALTAFLTQIGIVYMKMDSEKQNDYLMDHSASILLISPSGQLVKIFSAPHSQDAIATLFTDIKNLIETSS